MKLKVLQKAVQHILKTDKFQKILVQTFYSNLNYDNINSNTTNYLRNIIKVSKNSKLINVNRKDELLSALQDFIKNKKRWNFKAIDGYKHIMKNFNSEITAKKYFNYFNLINKK